MIIQLSSVKPLSQQKRVIMSNQKLVQPDRRNALVDLDTRLSLSVYKNLGLKIPRSIFKALEHTGSGLLWLPLAPVVFLAPSASLVLRTCAANLLVGLLVDIAIVGTLKGLVQRARPVYNDAGDFLLVVAVDSFSFPSGHAARYTPCTTCMQYPSSTQSLTREHCRSASAYWLSHYGEQKIISLFTGAELSVRRFHVLTEPFGAGFRSITHQWECAHAGQHFCPCMHCCGYPVTSFPGRCLSCCGAW